MRVIYSTLASLAVLASCAVAAEPASHQQGSSDAKLRQEVIHAIPLNKLDAAGQTKVKSVLSNITVFRRLPVRSIDCDPDMYLFLVRNPDVIVNIWEALKLTQLNLKQVGPQTYRAIETDGTKVTLEYLYRSHDTHIVYAEGSCTGPLLGREVKGSALVILRSGYVRETDGRSYITSRMDTFLNVEPGAAELVTKTIQPIAGRIADNNFTQSVAFLGSLSRTAEVNSAGLQRLASKLTNVKPEVRVRFMELTDTVNQRAREAAEGDEKPVMASRPPKTERR